MNTRITTTIIALLLAAGAALAEDPYQGAWSRQIGASSHDYSCSVAVDVAGPATMGVLAAGGITLLRRKHHA